MELRYKDSACADVNSFVFHYEETFVALYRDTGIWSEESMLMGAQENANRLFEDIYNTIERQLQPHTILGRKKLRSALYELCFNVGTRLVITHYSEDKKNKIRWVESISIDRKPIIF